MWECNGDSIGGRSSLIDVVVVDTNNYKNSVGLRLRHFRVFFFGEDRSFNPIFFS